MNTMTFSKKNGGIALNRIKIDEKFRFAHFSKIFLSNSNLASGESGDGKYIYKPDVEAMNNKFRLIFYFEKSKLSAIQFYLLSGNIKYEANKYPSDQELNSDFKLLKDLITANFGNPRKSINDDTMVWSFGKYILSLQLQNRDQSVYFSIVYQATA